MKCQGKGAEAVVENGGALENRRRGSQTLHALQLWKTCGVLDRGWSMHRPQLQAGG